MSSGQGCGCLVFLRDGTTGIAPIARAAARNAAASQVISANAQAGALGKQFSSSSEAASSCCVF